MLFKSAMVSKTWDTSMYYHEGVYYLYYLTSEHGPGDGFGVATSTDGVAWHDYGKVLSSSEKMVRYLGAGSVWKSTDFAKTGRFLCNYSEWRAEGGATPVEVLLFAWSTDLVHWQKFGDELAFRIDERFYQKIKENPHGPWEWPRWDGICVTPRPEGGYYGYWTATPGANPLGFGFGESDDGLHWRALEPPHIEWGDPPDLYFVEVGGVHEFVGRYYAMVGDYADIHCEMFTLVSDSPSGPFRPATKNFELLRNQARMHVYFSRFLDTPEGVLVNHHTLAKGKLSDPDFETYLAPLKRAVVLDGGLYLTWWHGNDRLKVREVAAPVTTKSPLSFDADVGVVLEGVVKFPGSLFISHEDGGGTKILVDVGGVTEIGPATQDGATFTCEERVDRKAVFGNHSRFCLLLRRTMLEFYLDDLLIQCYTMNKTASGSISCQNLVDLRLWQWQ